MSTFICTLEALKNAAEISRAVRFAYVREESIKNDAMEMLGDARNTGVSNVPADVDKTVVNVVSENTKSAQAAFVILHQGAPVAFDNTCPHRGTELDWNPGDVFDETGLYLICATHGALFVPETGLCVSGPCTKQKLRTLSLLQSEGSIFLT